MRYKSIELYNYGGIYNGMGLNDLKIDFTKCMTNKVIIKGKNGSGKSTLLNAINPNPDSNDNFIPSLEARKTVVLTENGIDYVIRYIHPVNASGSRGTTKGYIAKTINGQLSEMNPNGNISSCREILFSELNLDANYLNLARLTSENRGLVDSKPAERKKILNSIIHNLDTYNQIFKILSKKSSTYKSLINSLTYKIDYIGNEIQLNAKLKSIENQLAQLNQEKNTNIELIAAVKLKISSLLEMLKSNNYDSIVAELKDINSTIRVMKNQIITQLNKYQIFDMNNVKAFLDKIDADIIEAEKSLEVLKTTIPILLTEKEAEFKTIQDKQAQLDALQSDFNYSDIKKAMNQYRNIVDEYSRVFAEMKLSNINIITKDEFDAAMGALKFIKESAYALINSYDINDVRYVIYNRTQVINGIASLTSVRASKESLRTKLTELSTELTRILSKREIASELVNRPKGCTIDTCPYIEAALKAELEFPQAIADKIAREIDECQSAISEYDAKIEKYSLYSEINMYVSNISRELDSKIGMIKKLPVRMDFRETFFDRLVNLDRFNDITELYKFVDCGNMIEEYKVATEQLHKYEVEFKLYESRNSIIEDIIANISILNSKLDNINAKISESNNALKLQNEKLTALNAAKMKVGSIYSKITDSLIPSEKRQEELVKLKSAFDRDTAELESLQNDLAKIMSNSNMVENDIKALTEQKDTIKHSLAMLIEYKAELQKYNDEYSKIEKIKYYSSSSTGIQTLYMQLYMNKILSTANELLSLLFDNEFSLQPFIINEGEFRIPCVGSGLMHDDISSMSTAQKSMISMILSYSILHQSASRYNIISLDEMDGSLDNANRSYFMTLLDNLMKILRCEQSFIISHNSELISELADVIILKDAPGANYGGNVIWRF